MSAADSISTPQVYSNTNKKTVASGRSLAWRRMALASALAAGLLYSTRAHAQAASVEWRVAFNRGQQGPGTGLFGPLRTVSDNDGTDTNLLISMVTAAVAETSPDGSLSITASVVGQTIPGVVLNSRQLLITGLTANVAPGWVHPLNTPFPTIEILACYRFDLTPVGPPHTFGSGIDGFFTVLGGAPPIDFGKMGYTYADDYCIEAVSVDPPAFVFQTPPPVVANSAPPVPFNSGLIPSYGGGCQGTATRRIGEYLKFTLGQDGDAVVIPSSADAQAIQTNASACSRIGTPALSGMALPLMIFAMVLTGSAFLLFRRSVS
jgi:hypothetical protein